MGRLIRALWLTIFLPFWTVPFIFMTGTGGFRSHLTFHIVYPLFIAAAMWALWRLREATGSRAIRILALAILTLQVLAFAGHLGEGYVAATNGGFYAPEEVFEYGSHRAFATVTLPSLMLSQLLLIAMTIVWAVRRRQAQEVFPGITGRPPDESSYDD